MGQMGALSALETGGSPDPAEYGRVDQTLIVELAALVGRDHVRTGSDIAQSLGFDAGTRFEIPRLPDVAVLPGSTAEVASVVALANRKRIPLTPRGGGTGLAGGAVAVRGGILLDLGRLDRILTVDARAHYAEVEPGVKTLALQNAAREKGLLYAGDPCSNDDCVLGGNIATNAGGNRAVKYGVTSDQVLSLEVVTAQGQVTTLGARLKKNSTGYNLVRLFVGSEGTLGIITKATVKLRRLAPLHPDSAHQHRARPGAARPVAGNPNKISSRTVPGRLQPGRPPVGGTRHWTQAQEDLGEAHRPCRA
jgi:glycolate oxidase